MIRKLTFVTFFILWTIFIYLCGHFLSPDYNNSKKLDYYVSDYTRVVSKFNSLCDRFTTLQDFSLKSGIKIDPIITCTHDLMPSEFTQ